MYWSFIFLRPLLSIKFSEIWLKRNVIVKSGDDEKETSHMGLRFSGDTNKLTNKHTHRGVTHMQTQTYRLTFSCSLPICPLFLSRPSLPAPKFHWTQVTPWGLFLASLHSTVFCNSNSQPLLSEYQRWHFVCKHNLTLWHLEGKSCIKYVNMKEVTDATEVSFDLTNTFYSVIQSNS